MYGYEIFHEKIAENLINNVRSEIAQHAYIFEGEKGVGAMECAKLFAATLVCKKTDSAPCGSCNACIMAHADSHPDIFVLSPEEGKRNISVDQVREIVSDAYTKPYESEKKVYIIAYGDDMNEQAQNAFLKVLEEPPQYAVFVVLAENNESLLQTIRSRCTKIKFNPVGDNTICEYIRKNYPDDTEKTEFLVQYAGGIVGEIEKILSTENFVSLRQESLDKLWSLISPNLLDAYDVAEFLEANKEEPDLVLRFWLGFLRDMMLIKNGAEKMIKSSDYVDKLINLSNKTDEERVVKAIESVLTAQKMRKRYVNLKATGLWLAFSIKNN